LRIPASTVTLSQEPRVKTITSLSRKTLTAAPEGNSITLTYSILHGGREVANGIAVFERM
jgi:hypothetical protein